MNKFCITKTAGGLPVKYLVCRNGNRITVKRSDRCYNFGAILAEAPTLREADEKAVAIRARPKPQSVEHDIFTNNSSSLEQAVAACE